MMQDLVIYLVFIGYAVAVLLVFGTVIALTSGSALAPFIYTLF